MWAVVFQRVRSIHHLFAIGVKDLRVREKFVRFVCYIKCVSNVETHRHIRIRSLGFGEGLFYQCTLFGIFGKLNALKCDRAGGVIGQWSAQTADTSVFEIVQVHIFLCQYLSSRAKAEHTVQTAIDTVILSDLVDKVIVVGPGGGIDCPLDRIGRTGVQAEMLVANLCQAIGVIGVHLKMI